MADEPFEVEFVFGCTFRNLPEQHRQMLRDAEAQIKALATRHRVADASHFADFCDHVVGLVNLMRRIDACQPRKEP